MLIAIDAGNSHVRLGGYEEDALLFAASIATEPGRTADDYACSLRQVFALHDVSESRITGVILGSVVPAISPVLRGAFALLCSCPVLEVSNGVKTGLNIRTEQPRQVGADRVASAVAAHERGKFPCVIVDLGTATTFSVLDDSGALVASAITAGVRMSHIALHQRAAQLPEVSIDAEAGDLFARNTEDALRVGTVYGAASMVDGMVLRYAERLGKTPTVYLTGGSAELVAPLLHTQVVREQNLCLDGLRLIWKKTRG